MNLLAHPLSLLFQALPSTSDLRWQLAALCIGVVLLSVGLAGLAFFVLRRKSGDRSLIYFSLFTFLYAARLIIRQSVFRGLVPLPGGLWYSSQVFIDDFIVLPLTLFLIELIPTRWKGLLRWVLAFQIVFATGRLLSQILIVGRRPMEIAYHVVIVAYCLLITIFPLSYPRGQRMPSELKIFYGGLAVFGIFVVRDNLIFFGLFGGRTIEPIGFLVFVGCLGYLAAARSLSNEQGLLAIQKELEIARQIQSSILPREIPRIAGLDIAATYQPMTAVAGDFYDFLVVDEKRIGILVADVTGHGVPAALIASMLKAVFSAQSGHAEDPAQVLFGLNNSLCGKFEDYFVSAAYLFIDAEKQIFRYAAAGHPPLMAGSLDGAKPAAFQALESNGFLLGIFVDATYCNLERPFVPGDRCVLYTDGVIEAKNAAEEEFGISRSRSFLEAKASLAAAPVLAALLDEIARWSARAEGKAQEDDITLVAVDFRP
jgi:phosphoserine phosphatase RsbU/P